MHHYIDRAMSGTNDRRPEFQQMISDSSGKQFRYIIVYKFDRFARNMYDSAIYEHKLEQNGVKVLSATEQVGDGNESLIIKAVLRAMAEMYSRQLSDNVKRGMKESALKANSTGALSPSAIDSRTKSLCSTTAPRRLQNIYLKNTRQVRRKWISSATLKTKVAARITARF